jgi:hypothetical protein
MIRNIRNLISHPKILKHSISSVKSIERNFEVVTKGKNKFEYHNYNVIKNPNINGFYNKIVSNEIKDFNEGKDVELIDSYVKWSRSDDAEFQVYPTEHWSNNSITCVFSDNKINYQFYSHEIQDDILTEKDLLIFDSNVAIKFHNHGISNLLIFTIYSPRHIICADMLNVYGDEKGDEEYEKQSFAVG